MELKELLNNPGTAAFSRIKYLQRYGSEEQIVRFINDLFLKAAEGKYKEDWAELSTFLEQWEDTAIGLQFQGMSFPDTPGIPWTPLAKPLDRCRIALVTTGGVYVEGQEPYSKSNDPTYREIPSDTPKGHFRIWHSGYDMGPAKEDINCIFPIDLFKELEKEGAIGGLAQNYYSFMGAIRDTEPLIKETAPEVARRLKEAGVDAAFLAST